MHLRGFQVIDDLYLPKATETIQGEVRSSPVHTGRGIRRNVPFIEDGTITIERPVFPVLPVSTVDMPEKDGLQEGQIEASLTQ